PCSANCRSWMASASARVIQEITALLRQLPQHRPILAHDLLGHFHLRRQFGVEGGQPDPVRRLQRVQFVALPEAQPGEQFLGQDDAGRIADGGDLELHGDSGRLVITHVIPASSSPATSLPRAASRAIWNDRAGMPPASPPSATPRPSLRERVGALRNLPPFLRDIWGTSKPLTLASLGLRLLRALVPVA